MCGYNTYQSEFSLDIPRLLLSVGHATNVDPLQLSRPLTWPGSDLDSIGPLYDSLIHLARP